MKQVRSILGLVGLGFGAWGAMKEIRAASGKRDKLAMVNAAMNGAAVLTGGALLIRSMRSKDGEKA